MRVKSFLIILVIIATTVSANAKILSESESKIILDQCSRTSVDKKYVTGYWQPTAEQISELENAFPAYYQANKIQYALPTSDLNKFNRFYAGIIYHNKKVIYADYQYSHGSTEFIGGVCDGGPSFFGFEYDIETKSFKNLSFNGSA